MFEFCEIGSTKPPVLYEVAEYQHTVWEITCCTYGEGSYIINDEEYRFYPKRIVMIPPYTPHSLYSKTGFCNIPLEIAIKNNSAMTFCCFDDTVNDDILTIFKQISNMFMI